MGHPSQESSQQRVTYPSLRSCYRFDSRLHGTGLYPLQGDVPWFGESVGIAERPVSIGVPAAGIAKCFGRRESTEILSVLKIARVTVLNRVE